MFRSNLLAQTRQEIPSTDPTSPIPFQANSPIQANSSAHAISIQVIHRALLESVWGEPAHCKIRQTIQMFNQKRSSFGNYVRSGKGLGKLRLSLQVPAGDQMNSLLQISDGELLTTYETIGNHSLMAQIDLEKVRERLVITTERLQDPVIAMYLAMGGQAEELRKVSQKYEWTKITEGQLGEHKVWWIRGKIIAQPLPQHALALVDTRLFEQPHDAEIPPNIKLAIGHAQSDYPFWLYQVEKWNDGNAQGKNKCYVLTEWDDPVRLVPAQITDELFRLTADQTMREIRDETKLYLPPLQTNLAAKPQPQR